MNEDGETKSEDSEPVFDVIGVLDEDNLEFPGHLTLQGKELKISIDAPSAKFRNRQIKIIGVLELKIMPHASLLKSCKPDDNIEADSMPAVILLTYLADLFDYNSNKTIFFASVRSALVKLKKLVDQYSNQLKSRVNFEGPDLTPIIKTKKDKGGIRRKSAFVAPISKVNFQMINGPSVILTPSDTDFLRLAIPYRMRQLPWKRIYISSIDGVSLLTLLDKSKKLMPLLLCIKTTKNVKLGAYVSSGFKQARGFSGSGETFVFKFSPEIQVFKWSCKNDYYVAASSDSISIGGGETGSAIFLNTNLEYGASDPCITFDSPALIDKSPFKIANVEIWHIKSYSLHE